MMAMRFTAYSMRHDGYIKDMNCVSQFVLGIILSSKFSFYDIKTCTVVSKSRIHGNLVTHI